MSTINYTKACTIVLVLMLTACGGGGSSSTAGAGVTSATALVDWTWVSGAETVNHIGSFTGSADNYPGPGTFPGAMEGSMTWANATTGDLWMFGGGGCYEDGCGASTGVQYVDLNDLWKFDGTSWTLVKGSGTPNPRGVYGTQGTADPANMPGSRQYAATWTDSTGNMWMFGGRGLDSATTPLADLSDLWMFDGSDWTWVGGSSTAGNVEDYSNTSAAPGDRRGAMSWIDASGDLWLFGGYRDSTLSTGFLNDLWKYHVATGTWTWISGGNTLDQVGVYGRLGNAGAQNVPGGRAMAASWIDASGNFWVFGGVGLDSNGDQGNLNDMWKYDVANNDWAWISGSKTISQIGTYGAPGEAKTNFTPGARRLGLSWSDGNNLWLFGGQTVDTTPKEADNNDLWKYNVADNTWAWMSGSRLLDQPGVYGTMGSTDAENVPGGRDIAVAWKTSTGFWLYGGQGKDINGDYGYLNDLWKFQPR